MLAHKLEVATAKEFNKNMWMKLVFWMAALTVKLSKELVMNLVKELSYKFGVKLYIYIFQE